MPDDTAGRRVSLAMIVRDEARSITRCLDSVRDLVDEMVVVDTGSVDNTPELAAAAGARVHHFTWVDDFAAARNAALDLCDGEWRLVLDADEWVVAGAETLAGLRLAEPTFAGMVRVESPTDAGTTEQSWQERLLPADVRYTGRVHEQPVHDLPRRRLDLRLAHDGYLGVQLERKAGRNRLLLEKALSETPDDAYLHYQLGKDHEAAGQFGAACASYAEAYALNGPTGPRTPAWQHALVTRYVYCLGEDGRTEEAIDIADAELPHWQNSADFWFGLGNLLLKHALANPAAAEGLLPLIESSWQRCLELGDNLHLPGSVVGRGSHLAARNLVVFYESQGRGAEADRYRALAEPPA
ncbi:MULTISPECIES: glycosyltransferase [unclassified Nocardioides]|uniref:tetratricopeptide repeat-containing glycosyltransferase family 2 protein n=1 Tax=unclassified Nocardioides TaxID=2615069 RepID=UPI00361EBC04